MSEYSPPNWTEPLSIYNPINFRQTAQSTNGGGGGGSGFLKYPVAQGPQTMKDTLINGSFTISASEPVNMGGNIVQNGGTPVNPTDLATKAYVDLNAGTQNLQSVLTAGNTTGNFHISHADNYGDIYNGNGGESWVVGCDPIQFSSTATNDLYLASNATDNFVRMGTYSGSTFTENARIGTLGTGEKRAIFAGTLNAVCIEDATGSKGTAGQVLTAGGSGASLVWGAGGGGGVSSVSAGTNISITGTSSAPIVNVASPLTSSLDVGSQDIVSTTSAIDITPLAGQDCNVVVSGAGGLHIQQATAGGSANPSMRLTNSNATTGGVNVDFYKNKTGATSDIVSALNFYGKDNAGNKVQYGGIESVITSAGGGGGIDGALDFYSCVNGVKSQVFRLNGADNENNSFRPLDMNGNAIKTSSSNLSIDSTSSSGTGNITITAKGALSSSSNSSAILTALNYQHNITNNSVYSGGELHYGKISTAYTDQIYRPIYQPLMTSSPQVLPVNELLQEGHQVILVNSLGDGGNELTIVPTTYYTITCMKEINISGTNYYCAGGFNHIEGRAEIRIATNINALNTDITGGSFQYVSLVSTSGRVNCVCYDPALIPNRIAFGGLFSATTTDQYRPTYNFPSNVSNIIVLDISNFSTIEPINMTDTTSTFPFTNGYGVDGEVFTAGTRAYDNTYYPPVDAPFYMFGGAFANELGTSGAVVAPNQICFVPNGSFAPIAIRWFVWFNTNGTIKSIVNNASGSLACGGDFTSIGSSASPYLAYADPSLHPTNTWNQFGSTPLVQGVNVVEGNFGWFNGTSFVDGNIVYFGYSDNNNSVYSVDLTNHTANPVLIKNDLTSLPQGLHIDLDVPTPTLNFITGFSAGGGNDYCYDVSTPHYLDLNGSVYMANGFYDPLSSPNLPIFFKVGSQSASTPYQMSIYITSGASNLDITTTNALPFVNGVGNPLLKYNKISLAGRNNFAIGTLIGYGTDDVRILIYSLNGATFTNV